LKGGVVANVVVPAPGYVRFASHHGFRPDFCEAADPESKGVVEHLVGYAKADLIVPGAPWASLETANVAAIAWCAEVNGRRHADIAAIPSERLVIEGPLLRRLPSLRLASAPTASRKVDALSTVRFGSARYSVPAGFRGQRVDLAVSGTEVTISQRGTTVARHRLVGPGELALDDVHYGRTARRPVRAVRPRTADELAFLSLGPVAEVFLRAAAATGATRLHLELGEIVPLVRSHGRDALIAALERALTFRRFGASDVRAILAAGAGAPRLARAGDDLPVELPAVPVRPLSAYALERVG
jgi:hypothetical protein